MRLADALRLAPGRTVAFTGAGGKSAALARLVHEIAQEMPLLLTTTTRLGEQQSSLAAHHVVLTPETEPAGLAEALLEHRSVLVTGPLLEGEGKWTALPDAAQLRELQQAAQEAGAVLLIEADGARGRSLKVPAEHEPVIPQFADLVVPVAGLDALGEPIDSPVVHRPERLAALLDRPAQELLRPEHLGRVLSSPHGGLKGVPTGAEVRALLNMADDEERISAGREVAEWLLGAAGLASGIPPLEGGVDAADPSTRRPLAAEERRSPHSGLIRATVLASLAGDSAVHEVYGRTAGIVLAAGESSRMGAPKQLIPWRGRPLVWHAVEAARQAKLSPLVVVVGASADRVSLALEGMPAILIQNPVWQAGQSTSVRLGVAAVESVAEAAVFLLSDMPLVTADLVQALVQVHRRSLSPLVAPHAGGRRANPVLFDRSAFSALKQLEGDQGGRALFDRFPAEWVDWDEVVLLDLDTPEDLQRLQDLE